MLSSFLDSYQKVSNHNAENQDSLHGNSGVATPTADSGQIQAQLGGTATSPTNGSLLVLAGVLVVAGLLAQRLRTRTAKRG